MRRLEACLEGKTRIIWDWNGTLFNDVDLAVATIGRLLHSYGLPSITREDYRRLFRFPVKEYYRDLGFTFRDVPFETVGTQFIELYNERAHEYSLFAGTDEFLANLAACGIRQSVLSAAAQPDLDSMLRRHGIHHHFDHVYGLGDHYAHGKEDLGRRLARELEEDPSATLLIGDTDHDVEVGHAMGVDVLVVADGHQHFDRLAECHENVIESRYHAENED